MEDRSVKRRNIIKNIAIVFLTLLLVLTLFSNTFLNMSLPEVATQYSRNGSITTQIRGTGNVQARDVYKVLAGSSSKVVDVGVKEGTKVEIGDVLFILADDGSSQLIAAIEKLTELKESYNDLLEKISPDFSDKLREITHKKEDLAKARSDRSKVAGASDAEKALKKLTDQRDILNDKISTLKADISALVKGGTEYDEKGSPAALLTTAKSQFVVAENALETEKAAEKTIDDEIFRLKYLLIDKNNAVTDAENALTDYQSSNGDSTITDESILAKERALEKLELEYERLLEDYRISLDEYDVSLANLYAALQTLVEEANVAFNKFINAEPSEKEALKALHDAAIEKVIKAQNEYNLAKDTPPEGVRSYQRQIEDKEITIKQAKDDLAADRGKLGQGAASEAEIKRLKSVIDAARTDVRTVTRDQDEIARAKELNTDTLAKAKEEHTAAKSSVELYEKVIARDEIQGDLDALQPYIDAAQEKVDEMGPSDSTSLDSQIKTLERDLEQLNADLDKLKEENKKDAEVQELKLETLEATIDEQQKTVDELSDGERVPKVTAPVAGTVSSVNFAAGQEIKLNDELAEIQLTEKGFLVSFPVTNEQASRLKAGDTANVEYHWGTPISAVIDAIKPDPANPSKNKLVEVAIKSGDVTIGTSLTFTIGQRSQNYDSIVPLSALRKDSDGDFVLVVDSKSTPLGNRYTARKVNVEILAQDDTSAAVQGLSYYEFIITTSSKPIESGDQVRLIET